MTSVELAGLDGSNPLALFCALGVLVAADDAHGMAKTLRPRLSWRLDGCWKPTLHVANATADDLVALLEADRKSCVNEPALRFTHLKDAKPAAEGKPQPEAQFAADVKPRPPDLRKALSEWVQTTKPDDRRTLDWFTGFIAEGAVDGKGAGKPSALYFTAGQQLFLKAACELVEQTTAADIQVALFGPWAPTSTLPVMAWDNTETRDYALRAKDPSSEKKQGYPGTDWLALRGLTMFSNCAKDGDQRTTAVVGRWKNGTLVWPIWTQPLSRNIIQSLLATKGLNKMSSADRDRRGISIIYESRILRSGQGGYGSVTPAAVV